MKRLMLPLLAGLCLAFLVPAARTDDGDVPRLIEKLSKDEKAGQRKAAAKALGEMGAKAQLAVPALVKALNDAESSVRDEAERALTKIGEPAVVALLPGLKDPDEFVRLRIVSVLGGIGPEAKLALPALETAKNDPSAFVKKAADEAITRIKSDTKSLIAALKDKDEEKRLAAVKSIALLGPHAKPLLNELCSVLKSDKSKEVRREASKTLVQLGKDAKDAVPALSSVLNDPDDTIKLNALQTLGEIGTDAKSAMPAIDRAGRLARANKNDDVYHAAMRAWNLVQGKKPDAK